MPVARRRAAEPGLVRSALGPAQQDRPARREQPVRQEQRELPVRQGQPVPAWPVGWQGLVRWELWARSQAPPP